MSARDPTPCIDGARLWRWINELGEIGAGGGGVSRPALSSADFQARRWLVEVARRLGLESSQDGLGNVFLAQPGASPSPVALTGSHLDSQPLGGRFDGSYGVLAGLAVLAAIHEQRIQTRRPVMVVAWTNEEGSRFQPGAMGSRAFACPDTVGTLLSSRDSGGRTVAQELEVWRQQSADVPLRAQAPVPVVYLEAHIEQGPVLDAGGGQIGVVTGVQGIRRFRVRAMGDAAHAGTTPRSRRRDALRAAVELSAALYRHHEDAGDQLRFTIGRFVTQPGGVSVVPAEAEFAAELRHPDRNVLKEQGDRLLHVARTWSSPCRMEAEETSTSWPVDFDHRVMAAVEAAALRLGKRYQHLPSGAGHDAQFLTRVCPTGMVFVPCRNGISHHPDEYASPSAVLDGTEVLAAALLDLTATT